MRLKFLFLASALFCLSLEGGSVSESTSYPSFCLQAATEDAIFFNFKRNPIYTQILEHVTYDLGLQYLNVIVEKYPHLLPYFDGFRENDAIGNPMVYNYGEYGTFSPTTLRYIKIAGDLIEKFGDLSNMHIVELGGGYGGQCKTLASLGMFKKYTIIDLPACNDLSRRYLNELAVQNVIFMESTHVSEIKDYDLLISNYAFSEIDEIEQKEYISKVINYALNGYMIYNFFTPNSLPFNRFCSYLSDQGRSIEIQTETPLTSPSTIPLNLEVVWRTQ